MAIENAFDQAGPKPSDEASRERKKNYAEAVSNNLARELAEELRAIGFSEVIPRRDGPTEYTFYGGLGSKRVDVSLSDEAHGLLLALSLKGILFRDSRSQGFRKNLANRRGDLCVEAITLHMRFPFAVVAAVMFFDADASRDNQLPVRRRRESTFDAACRYLAGICGRRDQNDANEKFEHVAVLLYDYEEHRARLYDPVTRAEITLPEFLSRLKETFLNRNPHWLERLA